MRPAIDWLITDTHFYHEVLVEAGKRPAGFTDRILRNWKYVLAAQDRTIHLGDVIFYKYPQLQGLLGTIPGKKVLVRGNHDRKTDHWYLRNGFDAVCDMLVLGDVLFSHKPVMVFPDGVTCNVHGHWHADNHRADEKNVAWYDPRKHFKLALEETDYQPVQLQEFLAKCRSAV